MRRPGGSARPREQATAASVSGLLPRQPPALGAYLERWELSVRVAPRPRVTTEATRGRGHNQRGERSTSNAQLSMLKGTNQGRGTCHENGLLTVWQSRVRAPASTAAPTRRGHTWSGGPLARWAAGAASRSRACASTQSRACVRRGGTLQTAVSNRHPGQGSWHGSSGAPLCVPCVLLRPSPLPSASFAFSCGYRLSPCALCASCGHPLSPCALCASCGYRLSPCALCASCGYRLCPCAFCASCGYRLCPLRPSRSLAATPSGSASLAASLPFLSPAGVRGTAARISCESRWPPSPRRG
jgi:hypothetical protein